MKYLLITVYTLSGGWAPLGNTICFRDSTGDITATCTSNMISSATLFDSKDACMIALHKFNDPTEGYCIAVNGFSRELKPY